MRPYGKIPKNDNQWFKETQKQSNKFYESINNTALRLQLPEKPNGSVFAKRLQDSIPPIYLTMDNIKSVYIKSFREQTDNIQLPKIRLRDSPIIVIHVAQGILKLTCDGTYTRDLYPYNSYTINMEDRILHLRTLEKITNLALVASFRSDNYQQLDLTSSTSDQSLFHRKPIKHINPTRIFGNVSKTTELPKDIMPAPNLRHNIPVSYIRANLPEEELRKRIIFLDAEFVLTSKGHAPGSVAILDFDGRIILDQIVKPESTITDYVYRITGFTQNIIDQGIPQRAFTLALNEFLVGKILVGSDLTLDIKALEINKENLLGIRDLSTSTTLKNRMDIQCERIGLATMAHHFWKTDIHNTFHSSLTDSKAVRDVYLLLHDEYEDDFSPIKQYKTTIESTPMNDESSPMNIESIPPFLEDLTYDDDIQISDNISIHDISDDGVDLDIFNTPQYSPLEPITSSNYDYIFVKIPKTIQAEGIRFVPDFVRYKEEITNTNGSNDIKVVKTINFKI